MKNSVIIKKYWLFLSFILASFSSFAQGTFKLSGQILNPTDKKVFITIYRNGIEDEEDYELMLDDKHSFYFSTRLNDIAYIDFHYGELGFNYWLVEQEDDIYLKFNTADFWNSFLPTGKGSAKWIYYLQNYTKYTLKRDWQIEASNWQSKLRIDDYFLKLEEEQKNQINFLSTFASVCSKDFVNIRSADIISEIQNMKIDYLYGEKYKNLKPSSVFSYLNFGETAMNYKIKSYDYTEFGNNLIDLLAAKEYPKDEEISTQKSIDIIKKYSPELSKEFAEKLVAFKLKLLFDQVQLEKSTIDLINSNLDYIENRDLKNYFYSKLNFYQGIQEGTDAKKFILKDNKGNSVSLKDFEGKNIYLIFWANWCNPCLYDLQFLENVKKHFEEQESVVFLYISLDNEQDWKKLTPKEEKNVYHLWVHPDSRILRDYGVNGIPSYFLINSKGKFVGRTADPSQEEGLELINQIEALEN